MTFLILLYCLAFLFQSTLPRREWHILRTVRIRHKTISIHTPTQGVTSFISGWVRFTAYFNPHSHAGSDLDWVTGRRDTLYFNPHSHAGSDYETPIKHIDAKAISIHTPTQGVTSYSVIISNARKYFNPHSHAGSDRGFCGISSPPPKFQSTLPRREWPVCTDS